MHTQPLSAQVRPMLRSACTQRSLWPLPSNWTRAAFHALATGTRPGRVLHTSSSQWWWEDSCCCMLCTT
jgi:hypothetical protein